MKNIFLIFLTVIFSCSSSSEDTEPNNPPSKPNLVYPSNNLFCIDSTINFKFTAANDSDGDPLTYEIEFTTDPSFSEDIIVFSSSNIINTYTLEFGQTYFWRVRAKDSKGLYGEYSDVFSFYTQSEGLVNNLPFVPNLIRPVNNSSINNNVNLEWSAVDIDGDELIYDIYLDTNNPPLNLILENYSDNEWNQTLDNLTNYYWRVIAKDGNGGETLGPVWGFTTN